MINEWRCSESHKVTEQRLNMGKAVEWQSGKARRRSAPALLWNVNMETHLWKRIFYFVELKVIIASCSSLDLWDKTVILNMAQHKRIEKKAKSLDILPFQSLLTLNNNKTNFATLEGLENSITGCMQWILSGKTTNRTNLFSSLKTYPGATIETYSICRLKKKKDNSEKIMYCRCVDFETEGLLIDLQEPSMRDNLVIQ